MAADAAFRAQRLPAVFPGPARSSKTGGGEGWATRSLTLRVGPGRKRSCPLRVAPKDRPSKACELDYLIGQYTIEGAGVMAPLAREELYCHAADRCKNKYPK